MREDQYTVSYQASRQSHQFEWDWYKKEPVFRAVLLSFRKYECSDGILKDWMLKVGGLSLARVE